MKKIMKAVDYYAVIGNPIEHSKSPQIHQLFAEQTGEELIYEKILSPLDEFVEMIQQFRNAEGKGMNITVPFKEQAFKLADEHTDYARYAGAVNTLIFESDKLIGANTDGIGLVRDLSRRYQIEIAGQRILLLGAGGAGRGVILPLMEQNPAELFIANRTPERAAQLVSDMLTLSQQHRVELDGGGFKDIEGQYDIIINATAASLQGIMPPIPENCLADKFVAYDMMYGEKPTAFENWCEDFGASQVMNGLGMLVEQAAESFYLWRGVRPETESVMAALKADW